MSNVNGSSNGADNGDIVDGRAEAPGASTENTLALPGDVSAVNPRDPFTSRATVITANLLTLVAYTLNWWSVSHGGKEYMPDWVLGFCWAPWGVWVWNKMKGTFKKS